MMGKLACPLCCGEVFNSREALRIHLAKLTENVSCPECHEEFSSIVDLTNHLHGPCLDASHNQPPCDPEEVSLEPEFADCDSATVIVDDGVHPVAGSDIVLTADGAADINVESYIPMGLVKEERQLANVDDVAEIEEPTYYYCSSCECNIESVIDHISMYHPNETVEYEGAELTMETNPDGSDLMPETIISDVIDESEPNQPQDDQDEEWGNSNEKTTNEMDPLGRALPRNAEELQKFLEGNQSLREASPDELLFYKAKRIPRQYTEREVEDNDGKLSIIYSCDKCSREFMDLAKFKLHRCPSQGPRLKVCPVCKVGCKSPADFITHFREQHPNYKPERAAPREFVRKMIKERDSENLVNGFSCTKCSRDFFEESAWKLHKCKVPAHMHKECPVCYKKFVSKRNYTVHLHNHGVKHFTLGEKSSEMFICTKCNRGFDSRLLFQLHNCIAGESKEYVCEVCGSKMSSKLGLSSHMRMHKPEEEKIAWKNKQKAKLLRESEPLTNPLFECTICGERLPVNDQDIHLKMHQGELFICPVKSCNKNFARQELLDNHSQIHNEMPSKIVVFGCFYCHQRFGDKDKFLDHIKKHNTPDRPYQCTHCGRGFQKPNERIKHEWVHTGHQPYVCLTCGMRFRKTFCLLTHERIHTGYRPYTCDTCGKSFRTRSAFTHHLRIHSDLRLFQCQACPKTFKTAVQLANHRNSHTKPFTCNLCNRRFINSYSMRRHVKKHPTYEHCCQICGAAYGRSFELRDHLIDAHGRPKSPTALKRKSAKPNALDEHSYDTSDDM